MELELCERSEYVTPDQSGWVFSVAIDTVLCCLSMNCASLHANVPVWFLVNACFLSNTILSAWPLVEGYYGVLVKCFTPFF